jgi:hypothetical protein
MEKFEVERCAMPAARSMASGKVETATVIGHAVRLQASLGTPGAVEYLKAHAVHAAVIMRVLSGGVMRAKEDVNGAPSGA